VSRPSDLTPSTVIRVFIFMISAAVTEHQARAAVAGESPASTSFVKSFSFSSSRVCLEGPAATSGCFLKQGPLNRRMIPTSIKPVPLTIDFPIPWILIPCTRIILLPLSSSRLRKGIFFEVRKPNMSLILSRSCNAPKVLANSVICTAVFAYTSNQCFNN
jgi:hypothetical protein